MRLLDVTLRTPVENLALDEALLVDRDAGEVLRLWEPADPFVVLGRSSRVAEEVDRRACSDAGVPIHRRVSGGGTIVAGPGCLMYAVVLETDRRPALAAIDAAHGWVLDRLAGALRSIDPTVVAVGVSDLARAATPGGSPTKFSGNSLRVVRGRLLYHGTLLYAADLAKISRLLKPPPREPDYRRGRPHDRFVTNLETDSETLRSAVAGAWPIEGVAAPDERLRSTVARLVDERYTRDDWRFSR